VRARAPFHIDAWVVLPDHTYCLWTLPDGDADFSGRWCMIKIAVSKSLRLRVDCRAETTKQPRAGRPSLCPSASISGLP
jgi:REP element-mobilizing transposase RayT